MADRTLTVNGQPFTFNRDRFAGVRTMTSGHVYPSSQFKASNSTSYWSATATAGTDGTEWRLISNLANDGAFNFGTLMLADNTTASKVRVGKHRVEFDLTLNSGDINDDSNIGSDGFYLVTRDHDDDPSGSEISTTNLVSVGSNSIDVEVFDDGDDTFLPTIFLSARPDSVFDVTVSNLKVTHNYEEITVDRTADSGGRTMTATTPLSDGTTEMQVTVTGTDSNGNDNSSLSGTYTRPHSTSLTWNQVGGDGAIYRQVTGGGFAWSFIDGSDGTPSFSINVAENVIVPWQVASSFASNNVTLSSVEETITVDRSSDRKGESRPLLSKVVGGATAAYSLRDLNDKQGNNKVVRVRRKSDNAEQDFTASGVTSGALTSFVNEDVTIYQSDYSAGIDGFNATSTTTATGNQDGVSDSAGTSKDNVLKAVKAADSQAYLQRDQGVVAGLTYTVSGSFFAPSANTAVDGIMIKDGLSGSSLSNYPSGYLVSDGTWTDFSFSYTATASGLQRVQLGISSLGSNPNGSSTGSTGDIVYIADLKFVETTSNGFVETWYDQSGYGHDATQLTASYQPKIVDAGVLVTDRDGKLALNGKGAKLDLPTNAPMLSTDGTYSLFAVVDFDDQRNGNDNFNNILRFDSTTAGGAASARKPLVYLNQTNGSLSATSPSFASGSADYTLAETLSVQLFTNIANPALSTGNNTVYADGALVGSTNSATSVNTNNLLSSSTQIFDNQETTVTHFLSEVIYYPSDQSANRPAIEANIKNQYEIS